MKKLLLVVSFTILLSCAKDDVPPVIPDGTDMECAQLHYGTITLENHSGYTVAYNFANAEEMDQYGVIEDSNTRILKKIYSGTIRIEYLNLETSKVVKSSFKVADCRNTIVSFRF